MKKIVSLFMVPSSILTIIVSGVGCQSSQKVEEVQVFFPAPPASPRVQFLTWANGAEELEPQQDGFAEFVFGEEPTVKQRLNKPYGVAARDGVVYVCDTKGLSLSRLDFKNKTYSVLGTSGPGRLRKPINIAIDDLGYKFVVDTIRKQVVVFNAEDQYTTAHEIPEPCHPVDVSVHGDELYVLDNDDTCQIVVLDRVSGEVKRTIGGPGGEPGKFKIPNSIALDGAGNIYVSDTHNWRIQKLAPDGSPIWEKGTAGYMLGQFGRPRGIRVGPDGTVYVVDGATELVQMFDPDGNTLMRFGGPGDAPGALGLPATLFLDKTSIPYFKQYVHKDFTVDYLMFVASQFGKRLVSVYAFGSFPEGYDLGGSNIRTIDALPVEQGIGSAEGREVPTKPTKKQADRVGSSEKP